MSWVNIKRRWENTLLIGQRELSQTLCHYITTDSNILHESSRINTVKCEINQYWAIWPISHLQCYQKLFCWTEQVNRYRSQTALLCSAISYQEGWKAISYLLYKTKQSGKVEPVHWSGKAHGLGRFSLFLGSNHRLWTLCFKKRNVCLKCVSFWQLQYFCAVG